MTTAQLRGSLHMTFDHRLWCSCHSHIMVSDQQTHTTGGMKHTAAACIRSGPGQVWECAALPLWVRVALYAQDRHGVYHAPGELRLTMGITDPNDLSRAIRRGIKAGLLAHDSTARNLYTLLNRGD